jgi:hypothetical protein
MAYTGDRYLYQGITSLADAISQVAEEHKREAAAGKAADIFFKSLPEDQRTMDPTAFANLSARDKAAHVTGMIQGQAYRKGQQDLLAQIAATKATEESTAEKTDTAPVRKRLMTAEADSMEAANRRSADLLQRIGGLNKQLQDRFRPDLVGPAAPLDSQEAVGLLARNGLLMDPQTDNLLSAIAKGQPKPTYGVPGTVTPLGNTDHVFAWLSPNSGTALPKPGTQGQPTPAPEGYALVRDEEGRAHYLKLPESKTPPDPLIPRYQNVLQNLQSLRAQGKKYATVSSDFVVSEPSFLAAMRGTPIDELIQKYQNSLDSLMRSSRPPAAAGAGSSDASFEDFQRWKQGVK